MFRADTTLRHMKTCKVLKKQIYEEVSNKSNCSDSMESVSLTSDDEASIHEDIVLPVKRKHMELCDDITPIEGKP